MADSFRPKLTKLLVDLPKKTIGGVSLPVVPNSLVSYLSINPDAGRSSVFDTESDVEAPGVSMFVDEPETSTTLSSGGGRRSWPYPKSTGTQQLASFGQQLNVPNRFGINYSNIPSFGAGNAGKAAGSSNHARIGYEFLIKIGYSPNGASGIIGNLQQESGVNINPIASGDSGYAYGIAQWRGERRSGLLAFASANNKPPNDFILQLEYLNQELKGNIDTGTSKLFGSSNLFGRVNSASAPETAAFLFGKEYERPKVVEPIRGTNAREILRLYGSGAPPSSTASGQFVDQLRMPNGVDYNLKLSKYFTLGSLSVGAWSPYHLTEQLGYTPAQLGTNLKALSTNVLDPVVDKFGMPGKSGQYIVNSGFRRYPGGNASQHNRGQAADLHWPGQSASFHLDVALWIKSNLPFDQLLLEKENSWWVHVSFTSSGLRRQIGTNPSASSSSSWRWGVLSV